MTEDEAEMEKYVRRHKPASPAKPASDLAPTVRSTKVITPAEWHRTRTVNYFITVAIVSVSIPLLFGFAFSEGFKHMEYQNYFFASAVAIFGTCAIVNMGRSTAYNAWLNGKLYPCTGWDEFLAKRSDLFWKKSYYTPIKITFKLKPEATALHNEVVTVFLKNWEKEWVKYYRGQDYESGEGSPSDFTVRGLTIAGDISRSGLVDIVSKMSRSVPTVTRMLGTNLDSVVIKSVPEETLYKLKKIKRDVFDGQ